ncbi:MAG: 4-hydroxy-tetrahydrodipicolinate synthase [Acidimicrobiales bacterium]
MTPRFGRVSTAMITPFSADGSLDLDGAVALAKWLIEQGNDSLVLAGTTGESATLSHDEQIELIAAVASEIDAPIIAGAGSNNTRAAVELTKRASNAGAAGILTVTPYYNRPSQAGLLAHFSEVAKATDLPVILYDIPGRTGTKIETTTLLRLADSLPNIVGLKDAAGDPAETARFIAAAPDHFEVYSGDDKLTLSLLAVGAVGCIGVATHWVAGQTAEMMQAFFDKLDPALAAEINQRLLPSWQWESSPEAPNPVPTKAMLKVLGQPGGDCRLPMGPEPEGLAAEAKQILAGLAK